MDPLDLGILRLLRKDSRDSMGNMAKELGISKATISRRIAKMEMDGVIAGYTLVTNTTRLGLMKAMIEVEVVGAPLVDVIEELKRFEEIQNIYKVFGDHSLICEVYAKSVDSLYDLIQTRFLKVPGIQKVEVDVLIEKIALHPDAELDMMEQV